MKSTQECNTHIRSAKPCEILPEPEDDRISSEKWSLIEERRGGEIEEKWTFLFETLFPNEKIKPSPCKPELHSELLTFLIFPKMKSLY